MNETVLLERDAGIATVTLNRPQSLNALSDDMIAGLLDVMPGLESDAEVRCVVLTGAGERAFCSGGDQSSHEADGKYAGSRGIIGMPIDEVHSVIRDVPKPVVAKVRGYAIGGGNVLATICDLTIAAESAIFGQVGPKMGSVDPGFGTAYLARVIGEKKAREMWYLCRRYSAAEAKEMGLVNEVVPDDRLDEVTDEWCREIAERSPTAIAIAKRSFNADSESIRGIGSLGMQGLALYYGTDESKEGVQALNEKRKPDFRKFYR